MASLSLLLLLPMFVFLTLISLSYACHEVDKEALLQFKNQITADPFKLLDSWTSSSNCCQHWDGVVCDSSTGRVSNLTITINPRTIYPPTHPIFLRGTLSPSLGNLTHLRLLVLADLKELWGPIPEELGNLSELTILSLPISKLSGGIPKALGRLSKLQIVNLEKNQLTGNLDSFVIESSLMSIKQLILSNNDLSGEIPSSIQKLQNLQFLSISSNKLSGNLPASIGNLTNLSILDLKDNLLTGEIPAAFENLNKLEELNLSRNNLTGRIPRGLGQIGYFDGNPGLCGSPLPPCDHF